MSPIPFAATAMRNLKAMKIPMFGVNMVTRPTANAAVTLRSRETLRPTLKINKQIKTKCLKELEFQKQQYIRQKIKSRGLIKVDDITN